MVMEWDADRAIKKAISRGEIAGAVGLVLWRGKVVYRSAFGYAELEPQKVPMQIGHVFDLASLTKVTATTTAILALRDRGKLSLDDPLSKYLPELDRPDKRAITIRHCLTHTSGLPSFKRYYLDLSGREVYLKAIASESLVSSAGGKRIYSDLGFILLGILAERVSGVPLSDLTSELVFGPLGMVETGFRPVAGAPDENTESASKALPHTFAATERCPWRGRLMVGEVHDENAYALGGVAGHAGLFSTADDLARFATMLLNRGEGGGRQILSPESVALLNSPQIPDADPYAGLGWKIRSSLDSQLGFLESPRSYGHTGFTGTSLWIDPDNDVVAILLTNAIHPSRRNAVRGPVRLGFHRAIVKATARALGPAVRSGLDQLEASNFKSLYGRRVGVVTNHTAVNSKGQHLLDLLKQHPKIQVTAIFGPEHGLRGKRVAGERVADTDENAIPIYSLYGSRKKPTAKMGANFDVMLYDIQDVGVRFYTYIWTLFYIQQYCAESGKELIVLDRPNPIGGLVTEGPILDEKFASFVGLKPLPIRYGLTVGELALLFNQSGWLGEGLEAELKVVKMKGWKRSMWFDDTGLPWIAPSPNMPTLHTATVYPGTCLFEGLNWSEGRGTLNPFENVGGPGVDAALLARDLNALGLQGCRFLPTHFTPKRISGVVATPRYEAQKCGGVFIRVDDRESFRPVKTALATAIALKNAYSEDHKYFVSHFDRLFGTDQIREQIEGGMPLKEITAGWEEGLREFEKMRQKVMLYGE